MSRQQAWIVEAIVLQSFSEYSESLAFEMLKREQIHQKHVLLIIQKSNNKQLL